MGFYLITASWDHQHNLEWLNCKEIHSENSDPYRN